MTGLSLIALGTGGIKPCVAAFGGDQFEDKHVRIVFLFFHVVSLSLRDVICILHIYFFAMK